MKLKTNIRKNKFLTKSEKNIINKNRVKEFGKNERKDFKKDYEPDTKWFFIKEKKKIVALGALRPIKINYFEKEYNILGICSIISIEKGKGYGKILISEIIKFLKDKKITGLGFTGKTEFFGKAGLKIKKYFIKRFVWVKPNGEKIYDNDGDGIYYEGKDKLISKILKTKSPAHIFVEHW